MNDKLLGVNNLAQVNTISVYINKTKFCVFKSTAMPFNDCEIGPKCFAKRRSKKIRCISFKFQRLFVVILQHFCSVRRALFNLAEICTCTHTRQFASNESE